MTTEEFTPPLPHDRLSDIFERQRQFSNFVRPRREFPNPDPTVLMAQLREQGLAIMLEIAEAIEKTAWKPWLTEIPPDPLPHDAFKKEMVDVLHFMVNLCILAGITPDELYQGYRVKNLINIERQNGVYDGRSTKCPGCNDALDDSTGCHYDTALRQIWCARNMAWLDRPEGFRL